MNQSILSTIGLGCAGLVIVGAFVGMVVIARAIYEVESRTRREPTE
jgi:hypothetical protein